MPTEMTRAASLDRILRANGKATGDELRQQIYEEEAAARKRGIDSPPKYLTGKQRRKLKKCIQKGAQE